MLLFYLTNCGEENTFLLSSPSMSESVNASLVTNIEASNGSYKEVKTFGIYKIEVSIDNVKYNCKSVNNNVDEDKIQEFEDYTEDSLSNTDDSGNLDSIFKSLSDGKLKMEYGNFDYLGAINNNGEFIVASDFKGPIDNFYFSDVKYYETYEIIEGIFGGNFKEVEGSIRGTDFYGESKNNLFYSCDYETSFNGFLR